jgi:hypothetical protein
MYNVFHIQVSHLNEWATKTPKSNDYYNYNYTTLYNDPYSIVINS